MSPITAPRVDQFLSDETDHLLGVAIIHPNQLTRVARRVKSVHRTTKVHTVLGSLTCLGVCAVNLSGSLVLSASHDKYGECSFKKLRDP